MTEIVDRPAGLDRPSLISFLAAATVWLLLMPGVTRAQGQERWRLYEQEHQITLFKASSDETDAYGSPSFSCAKGSGTIDVTADMNDQLRRLFADLIGHDKRPTVMLDAPDPGHLSLAEVSFSEMGGWFYKFDVAAESKAFDIFTKTGIFSYKVADVSVSSSFRPGIENAVKFLKACRAAR